jgi:hypothetical protein
MIVRSMHYKVNYTCILLHENDNLFIFFVEFYIVIEQECHMHAFGE